MALLRSDKKADVSLPSLGESGRTGMAMWDQLGGNQYNPDNIGITVYKKMMEDAELQAAYSLVKYATLSRDWRILGTTDMKDEVEFLKYNFDHMEGRLDGSLSGVLESIIYGFSASEIVWEYLETGPYSGKIGLKKIKTLDPETIEFKVDKFGNLEEVIQKVEGTGEKNVSIPVNKVIVLTENKQHGNYYGISRLKAVYKNWFIKDTITKFWNIFLERFGMPIVVGTVPNTTFMSKMKDVLDNLQSKTSLVKTAGWEIELLEGKKSGAGTSEYMTAINYHNSQMLKGMLVPSLMIEVEKSGSYALGKTHFDIFALMLKNIENDLTSLVERYLIRPMIEYNFGVMDEYPEFKFEPLTNDDLLNLSKVFALLVKNGIVGNDEMFMRDMMNIPHRQEALIEETSGSKLPPSAKGDKVPPIPAPAPAPGFGGGAQNLKVPTNRDGSNA